MCVACTPPAGPIWLLAVYRGAGGPARECRAGSTLNVRRHRGRKSSVSTAAPRSEGHACANLLWQRKRLVFRLSGGVAEPQSLPPGAGLA